VRNFDTGATRDSAEGKPVFNGFLSHEVLRSYAAYMHENRVQADGKLRAPDNWKKGISEDVYMDSLFRHFMDVWEAHEDGDREKLTESLNAVLFNAMGMQYENLKKVKHTSKTQVTVNLNGNFSEPLPPLVRYAERVASRWND
jgi:hypothetical protein